MKISSVNITPRKPLMPYTTSITEMFSHYLGPKFDLSKIVYERVISENEICIGYVHRNFFRGVNDPYHYTQPYRMKIFKDFITIQFSNYFKGTPTDKTLDFKYEQK